MKWYCKGLSFHCKQCGQCCTGSPGYVWLSKKDRENICSFLKIEDDHFLQTYTRRVGSRISLLEKHNYDCIFFKDRRCQIYPARPIQCQTFPFWPSNVVCQKSWDEVKSICPGLSDDEINFTEKMIEEKLQTYKKNFP